MSAWAWSHSLAQPVAWLSAYLILIAGRGWLERWAIARFQQRASGGALLGVHASARDRALYALAAAAGLLGGAAIPLAPEIRFGKHQITFHLFGDADSALLLSLAAIWIGAGLLSIAGSGRRSTHAAARRLAGTTLLYALPVILLVSGLSIAGSMVRSGGEGSLSLDRLIGFQGGWNGLRWTGFLQPLAGLLWLACLVPLSPAAQQRTTLAWQVTALNRALLSGAVLFGGWQGPFVGQIAWIGLLYTALKMAAFTLVQVWIEASLPGASLHRRAQTVWTVIVPLAVLNLAWVIGVASMR
jgi:NADH:ubiquinone oxidoreductase subunit H